MNKVLIFLVFFGANFAFAQDSTPNLCIPVQDCVDNALPTTVQTCTEATTTCAVANPDSLALSAGILSARAIEARKCSTKEFKDQNSCSKCYSKAKEALKFRYDKDLFHGLLGRAASNVEYVKHQKCDVLPKKPRRSEHSNSTTHN